MVRAEEQGAEADSTEEGGIAETAIEPLENKIILLLLFARESGV